MGNRARGARGRVMEGHSSLRGRRREADKMRHLLLALAASLGLVAALPGSVTADVGLIQTNQATLSCNDGHSVILDVDSATLASLAADVQSINTSGTGTSCSLATATIDPSSETAEWTVYDYNPSNQALA